MIQAQSNGGTVVAFRPAGLRPKRSSAPAGEVRGAVILFTGTRYDRAGGERQGMPAASAPDRTGEP